MKNVKDLGYNRILDKNVVTYIDRKGNECIEFFENCYEADEFIENNKA